MFKHIIMRKPNYDKFPSTKYEGEIIIGWEEIVEKLKSASAGSKTVAVELYTGVYESEVIDALSSLGARELIIMRDLMKPEDEVVAMTAGLMTDDTLFGHVTYLDMKDYFCPERRDAPLPITIHSLSESLICCRTCSSFSGQK